MNRPLVFRGPLKRYRHRVVDHFLDEWFPHLPAVSLEGPKGVGKTATAQQRAVTAYYYDDPARMAMAQASPSSITRGAPPILLDEWQRVPYTWDAVRRAVDEDDNGGQFILTGSASAVAGSTHSGAGRIHRVRMWPLTLPERGLASPSVSLGALLRGGESRVDGATELTVVDYAQAITRSGLPALQDLPQRVAEMRVAGYVDRVVETEILESGGVAAKPHTLRRWLAANCAAVATTTSYDNLRDAASAGEHEKLAKATDLAYREALQRLWIVEPIPAWAPMGNYLKRLGKAPKHGLADPGLAAAALGLSAEALLDGGEPTTGRPAVHTTMLGALFESLVVQHIRVFAQNVDARVYHARTQGGREEIDIVVERRDGRFLGLEVKLAAAPPERSHQRLAALRERIGPDMVDAAVITTGPEAYRTKQGVAIIPFGLLGE